MKSMKWVMGVVVGLVMGLGSMGAQAQGLDLKVALIKGGLQMLTKAMQPKQEKEQAAETKAEADKLPSLAVESEREALNALPTGGLDDLPPETKARVQAEAMKALARINGLTAPDATLSAETKVKMAKAMASAAQAQSEGPISAMTLEGDPMKPEIVKEVAVRAVSDAAVLALTGKPGASQVLETAVKRDTPVLHAVGNRIAALLLSK